MTSLAKSIVLMRLHSATETLPTHACVLKQPTGASHQQSHRLSSGKKNKLFGKSGRCPRCVTSLSETTLRRCNAGSTSLPLQPYQSLYRSQTEVWLHLIPERETIGNCRNAASPFFAAPQDTKGRNKVCFLRSMPPMILWIMTFASNRGC